MDPLAELAEVVAGYRVTELGSAEPIPRVEWLARVAALRQIGQQAPMGAGTVDSFIRWYFTPRFKRPISWHSKMTVETYICRLLVLDTKEARQEAVSQFAGHPLLSSEPPACPEEP